MKKIITLSIVCLISGQLFAQTNKTSTTTAKPTKEQIELQKEQIELQKQQETSSLSLKAATDKNIVPATNTTALPAASKAKKAAKQPKSTKQPVTQ